MGECEGPGADDQRPARRRHTTATAASASSHSVGSVAVPGRAIEQPPAPTLLRPGVLASAAVADVRTACRATCVGAAAAVESITTVPVSVPVAVLAQVTIS